MSLQATNRAFTVFGFMGFLAGIILLPMHCRARNISICLYIVWTSFLCLIFCVNSIVWNNNVVNWAPVWCDFSSRLITASAVGSQVGLLCIVRHLYRIITMKSTNDSSHEIRRELIVVLCAGISIPLVLSVFQYITEHSRFSILENIGCFPTVPPTQITIPLYLIWPFVFGIVSFLYAGFTLHAVIQRKVYNRQLEQHNENLHFSHYWRLLALTFINIVCTLQCSIGSLLLELVTPSGSLSTTSVNPDLYYVLQVPTSMWADDYASLFNYESYRWIPAFYSLAFFAFFGFTEEARHFYRLAFSWITRRLGFRSPSLDISGARNLPPSTHYVRRKHDLCSSTMSEAFDSSLYCTHNCSSGRVSSAHEDKEMQEKMDHELVQPFQTQLYDDESGVASLPETAEPSPVFQRCSIV